MWQREERRGEEIERGWRARGDKKRLKTEIGERERDRRTDGQRDRWTERERER